MHLAMIRRKAVEELTARKTLTISTMSAALYANTNLDSKENANKRAQMIEEFTETMETKYQETLAVIYGAPDPNAIEAIDMDDPFYAGMRIPETVVTELTTKE